MPKNDRGPTPKETIRILKQLIELKLLNEKKFKEMHHFTKRGKTGGSLARFENYCLEHESFSRNSNNDKLARDLQKMLDGHES